MSSALNDEIRRLAIVVDEFDRPFHPDQVLLNNYKKVTTEVFYMSRRHVQKPTICICENKDADQLCSNCTADQCLCFCYSDSNVPLLLIPKFQASSILLCQYKLVFVGPGRKPKLLVFSCKGSNDSNITKYADKMSCVV